MKNHVEKNKILLLSDLHLTINTKDLYRWDIFDWLISQSKKHGLTDIYMLGDLTEKKDRHPSSLVNWLVDNLKRLGKLVILKGNHDYVDRNNAFFRFLSSNENITFISDPKMLGNKLFLPYSENPDADWKDIDFSQCKIIFMHQEVTGAVYANQHCTGAGIPTNFFTSRGFRGKVFSGHIHKPQTIDNGGKITRIEYIGAPYSVRHGDHYEGRALIIDNKGKILDELNPDYNIRWAIEISSIEELESNKDIRIDDELKITVCLSQSEIFEYKNMCSKIREWCLKNKIKLNGIKSKIKQEATLKRRRGKKEVALGSSDVEIFKQFCEVEKLPQESIEVGMKILNPE